MAGETIKRYVGAAGDAIAYAWQRLRAEPGEEPPVGAKNEYKVAPKTAAVGGIGMGTILMVGLAWLFLKGK